MTGTTNYGLHLLERADSGNWITTGLNENTSMIDTIMKQLSDRLTDANELITGLQNQLDTTNGSMTAQGGQITELENLINGANGNIATLTQAVEDLQTKQPTGNVFEHNFSDENKIYGIKLVRIGKLVMGTFLFGFNTSTTDSNSSINTLNINKVPKDFLPFFNTSVLPNALLGENMRIATVTNYLWSAIISNTPFICFNASHSDFLTDGALDKKVAEIQNYIKDEVTLTIDFNCKISDLTTDFKHTHDRLTKLIYDNSGEITSQIIYDSHWWNFFYMAN